MLGKEEIVSPNLEELKSHYHSIITLLGARGAPFC